MQNPLDFMMDEPLRPPFRTPLLQPSLKNSRLKSDRDTPHFAVSWRARYGREPEPVFA
jgi:hypothetical protein